MWTVVAQPEARGAGGAVRVSPGQAKGLTVDCASVAVEAADKPRPSATKADNAERIFPRIIGLRCQARAAQAWRKWADPTSSGSGKGRRIAAPARMVSENGGSPTFGPISARQRPITFMRTWATPWPCMPITPAAAFERSMIRPPM